MQDVLEDGDVVTVTTPKSAGAQIVIKKTGSCPFSIIRDVTTANMIKANGTKTKTRKARLVISKLDIASLSKAYKSAVAVSEGFESDEVIKSRIAEKIEHKEEREEKKRDYLQSVTCEEERIDVLQSVIEDLQAKLMRNADEIAGIEIDGTQLQDNLQQLSSRSWCKTISIKEGILKVVLSGLTGTTGYGLKLEGETLKSYELPERLEFPLPEYTVEIDFTKYKTCGVTEDWLLVGTECPQGYTNPHWAVSRTCMRDELTLGPICTGDFAGQLHELVKEENITAIIDLIVILLQDGGDRDAYQRKELWAFIFKVLPNNAIITEQNANN